MGDAKTKSILNNEFPIVFKKLKSRLQIASCAGLAKAGGIYSQFITHQAFIFTQLSRELVDKVPTNFQNLKVFTKKYAEMRETKKSK